MATQDTSLFRKWGPREEEAWGFPLKISKELEVAAMWMEDGLWRPRSAHIQQHSCPQDWAKATGYLIQSEVESEREKQTWHINTYMWNLEKWYRSTYFQGRNRDTDAEKGHVDVAEGGGGWKDSEIGSDMHTLPRMDRELAGSCYTAPGAQLSALWWPRGVGWVGEVQERRDKCTQIADHFIAQQKLTQHCKPIIFLKIDAMKVLKG